MDLIKTSFNNISEQAKKENVFVELLLKGSESLNLGYQKQLLETYTASENRIAGFRLVKNGLQAYSYTENLSPEGLEKAYKEAFSNLNLLSEAGAPAKIIPLPDSRKNLNKKLPVEDIDIEKLKIKAKELEAQALAVDSRIAVVPYSGISESKSQTRILNSNGLDTNFEQQHFSAYSYPLAKEGEVSKMSGFGMTSRNFSELDTNEISREAAKRTLRLLPAKTLKSGKYAVVIDREVASELLSLLGSYFSAKAVDENKSIFKEKLGKSIAASNVTLVDDPTFLSGSAFHPFDAEGEVSNKTILIDKGILKNYLTNLEYSLKMNLPHTASAARSPASEMEISCSNLIFEKGNKSREELLKIHNQVIYLTELDGFHSGFNHSTGDFSLPGQGFLYASGQMLYPVDQFIVSGNILVLLENIKEMGNEYNPPGSRVSVSDLLISELFFAGDKT